MSNGRRWFYKPLGEILIPERRNAGSSNRFFQHVIHPIITL